MHNSYNQALSIEEKLRLLQIENKELKDQLSALQRSQDVNIFYNNPEFESIKKENELIHEVMDLGNFTWWKMELPSGKISFGKKKAEFIGAKKEDFIHYTDFTSLIHPDDYKNTMKAMLDHLEGRAPLYRTQYRIKHADGHYCWFEDVGKTTDQPENSSSKTLIGYVINITDQKNAEIELKNQKKDIENYLDIIPDLLCRCKSDGTIVLKNNAWVDLLGYKAVEELNIFEIIHPDERQRLHSFLNNSNPENSYYKISGRIYKKDGTELFSNWHIKGLKEDFLIEIADYTERHHAELSLLESSKRFNQIATLNREIIWEVDKNGLYTYVNQAFENVLGYHREEVIGKLHFYDIAAPGELESLKASGFEIISRKEVFTNYENKVISKSGKETWLLTNGVPVLDADNNLIGYRGSDRDISEHRAMLIALSESEKRYKAVAESSNAGIGIVDKNEVFIFLNDAFARMLGYEKAEMIGHSLAEYSAADAFNQYVNKTNTRVPGFSDHYETAMIHKSGEVRVFSVSASSLTDHDNNLLGTIGVLIDITDKKKNEVLLEKQNQQLTELNERLFSQYEELVTVNSELIIARKKAEASDQLKSAFLNNISHEIRTPLNGIVGVSQVILQLIEPTKQLEELGSIMQHSTDRLINTIEDIIDASMFMSGNVLPVYSSCDFSSLIHDLASMYEHAAKRKELTLNFNIDPVLESTLPVIDAKLTSRILGELVDNAVKYTSTGKIDVIVEANYDHLMIKVSDTGIGIPENVIPIIFKPFSQTDGSSTRLKEGNGLGLFIVKEAIKLIGGKITVHSNTESGTVFIVELPVMNALTAEKESAELNIETTSDSFPTILIAEDEEFNLKYITRLLIDRKCHLFTARNGIEAIDQLDEHPEISLILMDLKMPGMNGFEASEIAKARFPHIKIAAITAYASMDDYNLAIASGCNEVITKPFKANELYSLIFKLTGKNI